jgi:hypothetical protein
MKFTKTPQLKPTIVRDKVPGVGGYRGYTLKIQLGPWDDQSVAPEGRKVKWALMTADLALSPTKASPEMVINTHLDPEAELSDENANEAAREDMMEEGDDGIPVHSTTFEMLAFRDADSAVIEICVNRRFETSKAKIIYAARDVETNEELGLGTWIFQFPN